jgi:hypothetical protein
MEERSNCIIIQRIPFMSVSLPDLIETERQRYINVYTELIESVKEGKPTYATEVLIQVNDEDVPEPFNLMRADIVYTEEEDGEAKVSEIRPQDNPDFEPLGFELDDLGISIYPFCWNSCEVFVNSIDVEELKEWIRKWLKQEEEDDEVEGQVSEAIHSCSQPVEEEGGRLSFVVDFGTAPTDAFIELLAILAETGTTEVIFQTTEV